MVDKTENELTEKKFYLKLCDLALYGNNEEFFDTIRILEKLETVEAVDVLLKILLHHPKGLPSGDFDRYKLAAVIPLIRSWKLAPEKIIPLIPIFCKYYGIDDHIEVHLPGMFDEIGEETLQKAFISGLNDYDYRVRLGTITSMHECGIMDEDNLPLLVDAYKIETNVWVQNIIESILFSDITEENSEVFFDLMQNFRVNKKEVPQYSEYEMEDSEDMLPEKITSIFLRKWKEESDETIRDYLHYAVKDLIGYFEEDVKKALNKDEVKQLQEMGIIKK